MGSSTNRPPTLGRKRFGDGLFYKQAAPLGLKRFGDGFFYKQAAPLVMFYLLVDDRFFAK
jgi:hypothetical protein